MGKLMVEDKTIVVPGEVLADGMDYLPGQGTYRLGDKILADKVGLVTITGRALKLISMSGRYSPKRNDVIIAKVIDVAMSGWRVEINSAYTAMLPVKDASSEYIARGADLTQYFNIGDYLVTKITNVTSQKLVDISTKGPGLHKLNGGKIIHVNPHKVPRIIGKQGSMVSMIKNATKCRIIVGQNGLIWIDGEPKEMVKAIKAINTIEENSHTSGLTDKMKEFLECK
ncbi:MAG: exosome complex RNA-binding protein Rrp4 [Candidatus Woesearchaeota archaeon]